MTITGPARTPYWRGWLSSFSLSRHSKERNRENRTLGNVQGCRDRGEAEGQERDYQTPPTWMNSHQGDGLLGSSCPWMRTCLQ